MRSKDEGKMKSIVEFIDKTYFEYDYIPSVKEIADEMGMEKGNVSRYLAEMEKRGMVDIACGWRGVRTRSILKANDKGRRTPVIGEIACGTPILAEQNIESYVYLSSSLFGEGNFFILRAKGDSMINAGINDKDLVIVRQQNNAEDGQIVVALTDLENATLKRFYKQDKRIRLHPENDEMEDMYYDEISIQGVPSNNSSIRHYLRQFNND